ncbi:MAG: hypothetical protein M3R30_02795 [Candidatus Eremiobacteraeota bacterium]|nr:hypothetical protein [Candidatus Eremiobacteraeota bacterium]
MKRLYAAACGLVFAAALAGCGSTTDSLDFKVPTGFESKMNTFVVSVWTKGDKSSPDQLIVLFKSPVKSSKDVNVNSFDTGSISSSGGMKNTTVQSKQQINICGDHPALLVKATGTSEQAKGKEMDVEMLFTSWDGTIYMAMYGYDHKTTPDAEAESAIKSVCQKTAT